MPEPPKESIKGNSLEGARQDQDLVLAKLKAIEEPYKFTFKGLDIIVYPGVFPPFSTDTELLAEHIKVEKGDRVLDMTTGTGVLAIVAGKQGATGIAVDLNPEAVRNAAFNFDWYNRVPFEARGSDLFENVPQEQFNLIIANGPYTEGEVKDPLQLVFYGARDFHARFFAKAGEFLKPNGRVLITFAEWGEIDFFEGEARKNGFSFEVIDKKESPRGKRTYRLYEMRRQSAGAS